MSALDNQPSRDRPEKTSPSPPERITGGGGCSGPELRARLVRVALDWQRAFGVAPRITSELSEYDAACLVGCPEPEYCAQMVDRTAVSPGYDFKFGGARYQVKANRPSGKGGSFVTLVSKANNYDWDYLVWILYDTEYNIQEAWLWEVGAYIEQFDSAPRLSPTHMRSGVRLYPPSGTNPTAPSPDPSIGQ